MYSGPFRPGDKVQLTDAKRRHFTIELVPGANYHTHKGAIAHDDIIGADEAPWSSPPWDRTTCASVTCWWTTCCPCRVVQR